MDANLTKRENLRIEIEMTIDLIEEGGPDQDQDPVVVAEKETIEDTDDTTNHLDAVNVREVEAEKDMIDAFTTTDAEDLVAEKEVEAGKGIEEEDPLNDLIVSVTDVTNGTETDVLTVKRTKRRIWTRTKILPRNLIP